MDEILASKIQSALLAIEAVREELEAKDADEELMDACAMSSESMESLACSVGFGVVNGVLVPA